MRHVYGFGSEGGDNWVDACGLAERRRQRAFEDPISLKRRIVRAWVDKCVVDDYKLSGMTRDEFLRLFDGNRPLRQEAEYWWGEIETCAHPYGKLWFRHWLLEHRAHPQIGMAFAQATDLGLVRDFAAKRYLACELFSRLFDEWKKLRRPGRSIGLFSGDGVKPNSLASVTFTRIDAPETAFPSEIRKAAEKQVARKNIGGDLATWWVAPLEEIPGRLRQRGTDIDVVRDQLGLYYMNATMPVVALVWSRGVTGHGKVPTVLDGRLAFWKPSERHETWGRTLNLHDGGKGVPEAVVQGEQTQWDLAEEDGIPCCWHPARSYDPGVGARYAGLCEHLLGPPS